MGLPRYLATAATDDLERTLWFADDMGDQPENGSVALVQCGQSSASAAELARLLTAAGQKPVSIVVRDREQAQSLAMLNKLKHARSVWVFGDNLFEAFMNVFATQLVFALRAAAREGLPVIGVGGGALALGGLLLAQRVCPSSSFDLVGGLGWAPRVLIDGGANRGIADGELARQSVCSLPGLLGVDLGLRGGVRVQGGRVDSVGEEPVILFGADEDGRLMSLELPQGQTTTIAPPPFAPFTQGLLPDQVAGALRVASRPAANPVARPQAQPAVLELPPAETPHEGSGRLCPMCNKVHKDERVELAA